MYFPYEIAFPESKHLKEYNFTKDHIFRIHYPSIVSLKFNFFDLLQNFLFFIYFSLLGGRNEFLGSDRSDGIQPQQEEEEEEEDAGLSAASAPRRSASPLNMGRLHSLAGRTLLSRAPLPCEGCPPSLPDGTAEPGPPRSFRSEKEPLYPLFILFTESLKASPISPSSPIIQPLFHTGCHCLPQEACY